ncbi:MAG TPA: methylmalonyl-CoA mutase family protein [Opitutales bacterium]|nr:methylmalonyl-CoA mutase family protein [Opitutales bacterium]
MNQEERPAAPITGALNIQEDFKPHTYEEWREAAQALLKDKPFDKVMRSTLIEGITLEPIYRREDIAGLDIAKELPGLGSRVRANSITGYEENAWAISEEIPAPTPEEFNKAALNDLSRGQNELNIPLDCATRAGIDADKAECVGCGGLSLSTLADLDKALDGVHMEMISTFLQSGASGLPVAALLVALAKQRGMNLSQLAGCVESDPLGVLAYKGKLPMSLDEAYREMAILTGFAAENAPKLQTIGVSGMTYSNGGASAVEELAYVLATAAEYIREMGKRGVEVDATAPRMRVTLSLGSNFFMEIAKLRAARLTLASLVEAFGGSEASKSIYIHARGAKWNKSSLDPYANLLRSTTETFSGAIGGANSMHTSTFDETFATPDEFSRRIARNQQVLMQEECELTRTIDPAGGSYYVEALTDQVAKKAWELFQKIEAAGGMAKALESGMIEDSIGKLRADRLKKIQQRRDEIVGVNAYPNATEKLAEGRKADCALVKSSRAAAVKAARKSVKIALACNCSAFEKLVDAAANGATLGDIAAALRKDAAVATIAKPVVQMRASEQYEKLRAASAAYAAKHGHAPQILQANLLASRAYRIRADWTSAFFNASGIQMLNDVDYKTTEDLVKAVAEKGVKVVVITSSDDNYATLAVPTAQALKALPNAPYVMLAGTPTPEQEAPWKAAGVDEYVNVRANNYALNLKMLEMTGAITK